MSIDSLVYVCIVREEEKYASGKELAFCARVEMNGKDEVKERGKEVKKRKNKTTVRKPCKCVFATFKCTPRKRFSDHGV
jgi:hypothetical protein